jgi:hypothetical protein
MKPDYPIDSGHAHFRDLQFLERRLRRVYDEHIAKGYSTPYGTFDVVADGVQGEIITKTGGLGVWVVRTPDGNAGDVAFWTVTNGELHLENFSNTGWSNSQLVEEGARWFESLGATHRP